MAIAAPLAGHVCRWSERVALAGDQCELGIVAPAQGERVAALVDDDRLPPAILAIVLGRDHQATDRDLGPDSDRKADIA
jgi:hypothetical protein